MGVVEKSSHKKRKKILSAMESFVSAEVQLLLALGRIYI